MGIKEIVEKIERVSLGDSVFWGVLEGDKIKYALLIDDDATYSEMLKEWVKDFNLGQLSEVKIKGNVACITTPFTKKVKMMFQSEIDRFLYIKLVAINLLENSYFSEGFGK